MLEIREYVAKEVSEILKDPVKFTRFLFRWKTLSPKQIELLRMEDEINVILAGRRFGKSSLMASKCLWYALNNPKSTCIVIGPSFQQAKIYHDILVQALESHPFSLFVKAIKNSPLPEILLRNGSRILFRTASKDGKYLRGKKVHFVFITESAFIENSVFEQVILPMRLDTGAKFFLESTPFGKNYFYELYLKALNKEKGFSLFHATVYDNPIIDPLELEKQRQRTSEVVWRSEYLAEFVEDNSAYFGWEVIQNALEDYQPSGYIANHKYVIGLDIAQKEDYTVFVVLDVTARPYTIAEYHRFNGRKYDEVTNLANELAEKYNAEVWFDATGVGRALAENIKRGVEVVFTKKSKLEALNLLLVELERGNIKIPQSWTTLRDELRFFSLEREVQDDCVIALALAVAGANRRGVIESFSINLY